MERKNWFLLTEDPEPSREDESETPKPSKKDDPGKESKEDTNSNKKKVALTFDDGPHPTNTLEILELLDKTDAKATFFMLGNRVDFYPDIAKVIAEKGHELGNHTWTHKDLTTLGQEEISEEVAVTNEVIRNATGEEPTVFRPAIWSGWWPCQRSSWAPSDVMDNWHIGLEISWS